ncbi:ATP-binding sensor histidine kinase [cf. Phormidesmis sp. LEGE 11477]|uniref:trifunctional serine/threonine-protein kinase/ATP-binding protein/sensor histidine kinase n=1 Tax=cf. Phormidesmis sp. LEGE 11477 TaxID=1828680 RepID=UPI001881F677|nr:ATP-binding sensor histidine kinase [cf. Phormidesmis sp. LEGE 11477]MBE9059412.1 AAA family ATPase [cf. Phormidesmis sp. LEGE 11477]
MVIPKSIDPSDLPQVIGYTLLAQLYKGARTAVYRAVHNDSQRPVIIKVLSQAYPSFSELTHFRNQYAITQGLSVPGVVQPLSLEPWQNGYALVMEDFDGQSLQQYVAEQPTLQKRLSVIESLAIALQMADILSGLSQHQIVHKDIKPDNILINLSSRQIQLIDFSIATRLPKETQEIQNPNVLEGSLAYLAPEQTGRMNRGIDYRTDFYGLGVTLYELLTGELPFDSADPLELIHCHIAKVPVALHEVNSEIPLMVSQIVLKLLAKNAEDRYQSAVGLKHDLTQCLRALKETGETGVFELGDRDVSDRFLIPEALYGREAAVASLLVSFDRVAEGEAEVMLVAGFSGIGKTAVVKEVLKPTTRQQGYFIQGKFDQFNRSKPLLAFVQAIRNLISQVLSESDEQLAQWRSKVLAAVGENGQILIDLVPELARILGPQPEVISLSGSAAQNRFNRLFQQFIQAVPSPTHPLTIFLDDLQWADSASLKLLELLMNNAKNILFLGAYRDNEVSAGHPFMLTVDELEKAEVTVNTLTLAPLDERDINRMVADTLKCSSEIAQPLTNWVYAQTQGNPFFTTQFLKRLHQEGYISFDYAAGSWQCDMTQVRSLALTDDVVSLMASQLQKLPEQTQTVLKLASCIGAQFDLSTLAIALGKTHTEAAADLWPALQEGFVLSATDVYKFYQAEQIEKGSIENSLIEAADAGYRFLHDRVQQAAYSLLSEEKRTELHLSIGQRLLAQVQENSQVDIEQSDRLFEITNHLNLGTARLNTAQQKEELAELNLKTGRKAKLSAAYSTAMTCFQTGIMLLPAEAWDAQYVLMRSLHEDAAEAAYLSAEFDEMTRLIKAVQGNVKDTLDLIKVYEVQIQAYMAQGKLSEAIAYGLEILEQLGVHLPASPVPDDIDTAINRTFQTLAGRHPSELIDLPLMSDPAKLGALSILARVGPCAYQAAPMLLPLTVMEQVNLSMRYGNAPLSASSYGFWGLILCGVLGNIEVGYQFGQLALALVDKLDAIAVRAEALFVVNADVLHYQEHVATTLPGLQEAYAVGLETGNFEFAALASYIYAYHAYTNGNNLKKLDQRIAHYTVQLQQNKQQNAVNLTQALHQAINNLLGNSEQPTLLLGDIYDRNLMLPQHEQDHNATAIFYLYYNEMILGYLLEDFSQAVDRAQSAEQYIQGVTGNIVVPMFYFYDALSQLASYIDSLDQADSSEETAAKRQALMAKAEESQQKIANWATHAPMNYHHKHQLIEAERLQALGEHQAAIDFYDQAIAGAKAHEYVQDQAIAYERAAHFYRRWGKPKVAAGYLQEAYYCYARWSAEAKISDLEQRYPELLSPILQTPESSINSLDTMATIIAPTTFTKGSTKSATQTARFSTHLNEALDFAAVLQASQALSRTIELDGLLSQLTQIILRQSGGDRCALVLADDEGTLHLEATATPGQTDQTRSPLNNNPQLPVKLLHYVKNMQETVVIDDLKTELPVIDRYLRETHPKSLICLPLLNQRQLIGLLYLHNQSTKGVFTRDRTLALTFLSAQAAISLENARLYQQSQSYAKQIEDAQLQTVQTEKMASLGNLVAGVAHEINNPIGFLNGSVRNAQDYLSDVFNHLKLYQSAYPEPDTLIQEDAEEIDLDFIADDFPKVLKAMSAANDRIKAISTSLRTFSRADTEYKVSANLQEGLDSTLLILKYRLKPNEQRPAIKVVQDYGEPPIINCFPGQLNQVFMNLLANAIDVFDEAAQQSSFDELEAARVNGNQQTITVITRLKKEQKMVEIRICDNGKGMPEEIKERIFDHLYTTKGVGKGTGLGLAIARQIVVETHGGQLTVESAPGEGTAFCICLPV